jgi:hypothetical protein
MAIQRESIPAERITVAHTVCLILENTAKQRMIPPSISRNTHAKKHRCSIFDDVKAYPDRSTRRNIRDLITYPEKASMEA